MNIMHLAGGGDIGGAKTHILSLVKELSKDNKVKLVSFRLGDFADSAKLMGIDVTEMKSPFISTDIKKLFELYDSFKPDIVHCHGAKANFMGLHLKIFKKACVTTTIHSDYRKDYIHNFLKNISIGVFNTVALRLIKFRIAVTEEFARILISRGFEAYNMFSIYNCIDFNIKIESVSKEEYFKHFDIPYSEKDTIISIAARLTKVKDIPTLIKGFEKAAQNSQNIRLLIAGDGPDKDALVRLAHNLKVSDRVHFLGWIDDVDSFFSVSDITVISSLTETFPYALTEGIRAGAIPISTNVGGTPSLIDHKVTGYIFEPKDYERLGEYISELANDKDKMAAMKTAAYTKTKADFSLEAMRQKQQSIYALILKHLNTKERNKVVICGAYGRGNAGDEAIKYSTLNGLSNIDDDMEICIMTLRPKKERVTDRAQTIFTFNIFKLYFVLKKTKVFVSGGGSLIQDVTSSRSLFFYLFTMYLAKKLGCKVIMFGCGIGPLNKPSNRKLAARVINKYVDAITLRDYMSKQLLDDIKVTIPDIHISADPAINLSAIPEHSHKIMISENIPKDGKYICLALRQWKNFNKNVEIAEVCTYIYEKHGYTPIFFPMEYPKDLIPSQKVSEFLTIPHYIIHKRYPTGKVVSFMSEMQTVIAMRLHALIFASANYIPVVGISYDVKVSGFMDYIQSNSCIELDDVSFNSIIKAVEHSLSDRDRVVDAINELKKMESVNKTVLSKLLDD